MKDYQETILTAEAIRFVEDLVRHFAPKVKDLLTARQVRQSLFDMGLLPYFLHSTKQIRESEWTVAPLPSDLQDRRVEITGPVDRKMIINALNSGANVFMADLEDSNSPTWDNVMQGQTNLMDAVRRTITYTNEVGKKYQLNDKMAVLMVRPRGWHLVEKHFQVDSQPVPAALFDFGLFFFHNAKELMSRGTGPYFYLPKMECHQEARLWNDVFIFAQNKLGIPVGTIKATCLIETVCAAFEMDEILWELREHSSGLNCGRWDYLFSFIKKFAENPDFILPDRSQLTMDNGFLAAYCKLLITTCHRRNVHAMGGMAAQIPIKNDPIANEAAINKVKADKLREVQLGHDGTWVAHPALVVIARDIFNQHMPALNQIHRSPTYTITSQELLAIPSGTCTEAGLRHNIRVGIQYLEAWLRGNGCVPLYNLMEDAATAELSRAQVWQWIHHQVPVDGEIVTKDKFLCVVDEEMKYLQLEVGNKFSEGHFPEACRLFVELSTSITFQDFLTLAAYDSLA